MALTRDECARIDQLLEQLRLTTEDLHEFSQARRGPRTCGLPCCGNHRREAASGTSGPPSCEETLDLPLFAIWPAGVYTAPSIPRPPIGQLKASNVLDPYPHR